MRHIETDGVTLALDDSGDGHPILLIHGFPELAYSWRHVTPVLADAGYRSIAYDRRGTGESSGPDEIDAYSLEHQVRDAIGILDRLGIDRAALVGHDWGSIIAYATALRHPDRISHVVSLNVPYRGHPPGFPPIDVLRTKFADRYGYVLTFLEPGAAEARFEANPDEWLHRMINGVAGRDDFLTDGEYAFFRDAFVESGMAGQLNVYRNIDRNQVDFADLAGASLTQPTLMVTTDLDPVLPASGAAHMSEFVPDLEIAHIENCGHWTAQERPAQTNAVLLDWLGRWIV
ncbi:MAG: alpha/beta hydrolase [Armatimonadetes bacterium]|nr:MAG: alpha/beta hydrolase [Armatimonadota bacterium]